MSKWDFDDIDYMSRSADHLGSLANVLKDLGGDESILHELTQNADDAEGASEIRFDVRTDELVVWNDGVFSNCGDQESRLCPWKASGKRSCDLHSFRLFAGRHKGSDGSTTGAFGVGFTCVYHLTDHPELITAGTHLLLDEAASEGQRIRVCHEDSCRRDHDTTGTTFHLPWARSVSPVRRQLQVETVDDARIRRLEATFRESASSALLFLKRIERISVSGDDPVVSVDRQSDGNTVSIAREGDDELWLVLEDEFETTDVLKERYSDIDADRSGLVQVAIRSDGPNVGRFYAGLPSQMPTGWSGHINATFYARLDRKSFEFADETYRSAWNLDLLDSAAHLVAKSLDRIADFVGLTETWTILRDLEQVARDVDDGKFPRGFESSIDTVAAAAINAPVLKLVDGTVGRPSGAVLPLDVTHYEGAHVVDKLGLPVVHPDLRSIIFETTHTRFGINQLTATRLIEHMADQDRLDVTWHVDDDLLSHDEVDALLTLLQALLDRSRASAEDSAIRALAIIPCLGSRYARADEAVRVDGVDLRRLFFSIDPELPVVDVDRLVSLSPALLELVPELQLLQGLQSLGSATNHRPVIDGADSVVDWLDARRRELANDEDCRLALRSIPIFPRSNGGRDSLDRLSVPSDFEDLLNVADLIESDFAQRHWSLLEAAGATELSAIEYLTKHVVPNLDELSNDPSDLEFAVDLIYEARRDLEGDPQAVELLRSASVILCTDGEARPGRDVHMPNPVVTMIDPDAPIADLESYSEYLHDTLIWLGVSTSPQDKLLNEAARRLSQDPASNDDVCAAVLDAIEHVATDNADVPESLSNLRDLEWLPSTEGTKAKPSELFPVFQSYLFESQGRMLALPRTVQNLSADVLYWLGMPRQPTRAMVIAHLRHCSSEREPMNNAVYTWLGQELEESALQSLSEDPVIQTSPGSFAHPRQTFWQPTNLGEWAIQLPHEMRTYQSFMDGIGVGEKPSAPDIAFILNLIANQIGTNRLEPDDELVVHECWALLDAMLTNGSEAETTIKVVGRHPSYPDNRKVLARPERLVFRDPRRVVDQIEVLANDVVDRERNTQRALEVAGVTRAEDVIEIDPINVQSVEDADLAALIRERRAPLQRAIDGAAAGRPDVDVDRSRLDGLAIHRANQLKVIYRASIGSQVFATSPRDVDAIYLEESARVVYLPGSTQIPVAREISRAIAPYLDPAELAPLIVTILEAPTVDEAMHMLDEYGVPAVVDVDRDVVASGVAVDVVTDPTDPLHLSDEDAAIFGIRSEQEGGDAHAEQTDSDTDDRADEASRADEDDDSFPDSERGSELADDRQDDHTGDGREDSDRRPDRGSRIGGGRAGAGSGSRRKTTGGATRMRSYVVFGDESVRGTTGDESPDALEIDRAGVDRVLDYERSRGRQPEEQVHENPGFDILSIGKDGEVARRIEVKSIGSDWTVRGVMLSTRQFQEAQEHTEQFWLYVVENAEDDDLFRIFRIQDPANRIDYFAFDDGWKALAEPDVELDTAGEPVVRSTRELLQSSPGANSQHQPPA